MPALPAQSERLGFTISLVTTICDTLVAVCGNSSGFCMYGYSPGTNAWECRMRRDQGVVLLAALDAGILLCEAGEEHAKLCDNLSGNLDELHSVDLRQFTGTACGSGSMLFISQQTQAGCSLSEFVLLPGSRCLRLVTQRREVVFPTPQQQSELLTFVPTRAGVYGLVKSKEDFCGRIPSSQHRATPYRDMTRFELALWLVSGDGQAGEVEAPAFAATVDGSEREDPEDFPYESKLNFRYQLYMTP